MIYPYSSPNFGFIGFFRAILISNSLAERMLKNYFMALTGKKYILITNSCRTALYLSYNAFNKNGEVITSPLTCKVAIDPIVEAKYKPIFADIDPDNLNINPADIEHRITPATTAIQLIHLGGVHCKVDEIKQIARKYNLFLVEDCAQALGAKFNNRFAGSFGDIACFSLIKNGYGIGGGILATNDQVIFEKASELNRSFKMPSKKLIAWRVLRNILATYRNTRAGSSLYSLLLGLKGNVRSYHSVIGQLNLLSSLEKRIAAYQSIRYASLHKKRKQNGLYYYKLLNDKGLLSNNKYNPSDSSFTKFFVYHQLIHTKTDLEKLHFLGLEVMHLEEKTGSPYQEQLIDSENANHNGLNNYLAVHDRIISLPLREDFSETDIVKIVSILKSFLLENTY